MNKEIQFGCQAKDKVTGYEGTIVNLAEWQNGTRSVGLQGRVNKDGVVPQGLEFEADNMEITSDKDGMPIPPFECPPFGSKVKHVLSGFTGTVIGRAVFMKGCERGFVYSDKLKDEKPVGGVWLDVHELEILTPGKSEMRTGPDGKSKGGPMPAAERR